MKKPMVIAGILIVILLAACVAAYVIQAGNYEVESNTANTIDTTPANNTIDIPVKTDHWEISGIAPVSSVSMGDDGTLFAFTGEYGNKIFALDSKGSIKWEYEVPGQWRVLNVFHDTASHYVHNNVNGINQPDYKWVLMGGFSQISPLFASDDGVLYLYVRENRTTFWNHLVNEDHPPRPDNDDWKLEEKLLAISDGRLLWEKTISKEHHMFDYSGLMAKNGRIFVFDEYGLSILNESGSELFRINNVASQAAVDENGFIYLVPAVISPAQPDEHYGDWGFMDPSGGVDSYNPDGTLRWKTTILGRISRPLIGSTGGFAPGAASGTTRSRFDTLPMYQNGTLYVPLSNGMAALNTDGTKRWIKQYDNMPMSLVRGMPVDADGNVYLYRDGVHIFSPDGNETFRPNLPGPSQFGDTETGTLYDTSWFFPRDLTTDANGRIFFTLEDVFNVNVTAYDVINGETLWRFTIAPNLTYVTIDAGNAEKVVSPYINEKVISDQGAYTYANIQILPDKDIVYVNFQAANYEWPIVLNESRCAYASTLYALDKKNGSVIWQKPLDSLANSMAVNNSTVYYGTNDGKISTTNGSFIGGLMGGGAVKTMGEVAAGGAVVTAFAYVLIKFFGIGAVARARGRLNKNQNRNNILKYISEHPGSTLYEISQAININVGTVRYHLFILSLNHRIVPHKAGGKYVRYFLNSGSYGMNEQYALSLVKREGMGRLLGLLLKRPGMSNGELSKELHMRESNVSRYISELTEKGIVVKDMRPDGMSSFSIKNEYVDNVAFAIERVNGS